MKSYLKQIRAGGCLSSRSGNCWIAGTRSSGGSRPLEAIHVEMKFSVGTDSPTPPAGQCFHIAD